MSGQLKVPNVLISAGMIQRGRSGVGRYVIELCRALAKDKRIRVHVAGLDADRSLFDFIPDSCWVTIPRGYARGILNLVWHQVHLPWLLRKGGYDLVHIPSYRRIIAASPIRQVVTIHDCAPFHLRDKYGFLRGYFGRKIVPFLARRVDTVISVSLFTKKDLLRYFHLEDTGVDVIYNGIDRGFYRGQTEASIGAFKEAKGLTAPYFLYISRIEHPGKNHMRLIEAYEQFRDEEGARVLLVLGGADWHGAEEVKARVSASRYQRDIVMPGFIDESEMPLWYGSALALAFPSMIEGFGLPVVEALACGSRVVCSDRGSLPEVGGEAVIYFNPEKVEAIASALKAVYGEDEKEAERRIGLGLRQTEQYDWTVAAESTCRNYLKLLLRNG